MPYANVSEAVAQRALSDSTIDGLIGDRFWPSKPPEEPGDNQNYACYWIESGGGGQNLDGRQRLRMYTVRVRVMASSQATADQIQEAIANRFTGNGNDIAPWIDRPNGVQGCFHGDDLNEDLDDDERQIDDLTFQVAFCRQSA